MSDAIPGRIEPEQPSSWAWRSWRFWSAPSGAGADEDQPRPTAMERLFPSLKEDMKDLPAFLRDTDFTIYLRSYYLNRENPDGTENEAWAFGGWAAYRSGWLFDVFQIGATVYGSAPLYAPDDKDGTTLLKSGQEGYGVLGEAFAALRYKEYAVAKGYRQEVSQGYINRQDNRMTPNTFEGLTLGGKLGPVEYLGGLPLEHQAPERRRIPVHVGEGGGGGQRRWGRPLRREVLAPSRL